MVSIEQKKLAKQIVEALAAVIRAENHARELTDDSRDTSKPLGRAAHALRTANNELAAALGSLRYESKHASGKSTTTHDVRKLEKLKN